MSIALAFDTHEFIKTLESAGMPLPQAEVISKAVHNIQVAADVATKADLEALDTKTEKAIALLRKDIEAGFALVETRFASMESKFKLQIDALQNKLLIKLSLVMVGLVGLLVTVQRFFPVG